MILASAQTNPDQKDINSNLKDHYQWIKVAADNGVDFIIFPEMSITGYERERAPELSFVPDDPRLETLRQISVNHKITIVAGAPVILGSGLYIGSLIFSPDGLTSVYAKHYLHPGEEISFQPSDSINRVIEINGERISLAICADMDHPNHAENAYLDKSTFYMPSIFFSVNGIPEAHQQLSNYARQYSMNILMSNFCGKSWNTDAGGRSAFWNKRGELVSALNDTDPGLLIVKNINGLWEGHGIQF